MGVVRVVWTCLRVVACTLVFAALVSGKHSNAMGEGPRPEVLFMMPYLMRRSESVLREGKRRGQPTVSELGAAAAPHADLVLYFRTLCPCVRGAQ